MRIIVVDTDVEFTNGFSERCKRADVHCHVFAQAQTAIVELKKDPDGVDLVLIARELNGGQDGLPVAQAIRKDTRTVDVPYVIMSSVWSKGDFAKHQKTEFGANAYHSKKSTIADLEATIEAVTGFKFPVRPPVDVTDIKLQVASDVMSIAEEVPGGISMEEPINLFDDGAPGSKIESSGTPSGVAIEVSTGGAMALQLETSRRPEAGAVASEAPDTDKTKLTVDEFEIALGTEPEAEAAVTPAAPEAARAVSEEEAARDLPYLFAGPASTVSGTRGIAVSPSAQPYPSHQSGLAYDDADTLKKYLTMREQDVSVLTAQLTYAKEELAKSEETIKRLTLQGEDFIHQVADLRRKIETQAQELEHASRNREGELDQLRFEVKSKIDRIKFLEERLNDSAQQYEKLKERVRLDIRKIRVREKELESKLEILKKDSETLIAARENKILELKRKIDLLEFNYDTLQDKSEMEKQNVRKGEEKIERIHKVLKLALGIMEAEGEAVGAGEHAKSDIKAAS